MRQNIGKNGADRFREIKHLSEVILPSYLAIKYRHICTQVSDRFTGIHSPKSDEINQTWPTFPQDFSGTSATQKMKIEHATRGTRPE